MSSFEYQVPSLAGMKEIQMRHDGLRGGLGDAAALDAAEHQRSLNAAKAAKVRAAALAVARATAKEKLEFYARVHAARRANGLPLIPVSVMEDLALRGIDPTTAAIAVPLVGGGYATGSGDPTSFEYLKNKDGTYVVETITAKGETVPGVVLPQGPGGGGGGGAPGTLFGLPLPAVIGGVAVVGIGIYLATKKG